MFDNSIPIGIQVAPPRKKGHTTHAYGATGSQTKETEFYTDWYTSHSPRIKGHTTHAYGATGSQTKETEFYTDWYISHSPAKRDTRSGDTTADALLGESTAWQKSAKKVKNRKKTARGKRQPKPSPAARGHNLTS